MLEPISSEKTKSRTVKIYESNGYRAIFTTEPNPLMFEGKILCIKIVCLYEKNIPYPVIQYNSALKRFDGMFTSFFVLKGDDEKEWIDSIQNASEFIRNITEVLNGETEHESNIRIMQGC